MSQRRILGIRWSDHVTNNFIQKTTGLMNLSLMVADRRHTLYGHVCRLPPETPAHRALLLSISILNGDLPGPEWKRPHGRPRRTWLQQTEEDFGAPASAAYDAAQNRSVWRSLRPSALRASEWVLISCAQNFCRCFPNMDDTQPKCGCRTLYYFVAHILKTTTFLTLYMKVHRYFMNNRNQNTLLIETINIAEVSHYIFKTLQAD